ncbi:MAG TPA: PKD domain-containing protein [Polyangia bacterium]|nr:PKD domain-containing protein [Polyangia bacterium]
MTLGLLGGCFRQHAEDAALSTERSALSTTAVTQGADELRTSWYPDQTLLAPATVGGSTFGKLFSTAITGEVSAQPLVSQGVLLVATQANNIYGLDAETGAIQWSRNLGSPFLASDIGCPDISPTMGITSTPVIDKATNTAYLLSKAYITGNAGPVAWYAHAVDVATGQERAGFPVAINGTASNEPALAFDPRNQGQRAGLLLMDGVVYVGFGSHCDFFNYAGWVVGISTSGQIKTLWTTESGPGRTNGAGIWQTGGGLVSDGSGSILFSTGNGGAVMGPIAGTSPPKVLAQAVVRLKVQGDGTLAATDFFSPYDAIPLDAWDGDLGSGGVVGLPASNFGTAQIPNLMVAQGKQGYVYLLDRDHLGGIGNGTGGGDAVVSRTGPYGGFWSKPAVWPGDGGYLYIPSASPGDSSYGTAGNLRVLKYGLDGTGKPALSLAGTSTDAFGITSSPPVVTSDGTRSGSALVWVIWSPDITGTGAQLRAYDAVPTNGAPVLRFSAPIGTSAKYTPPGVGSGRIYVGTRDGHVMGFGAPAAPALIGSGIDLGYVIVGQSASATLTLTATTAVTVNSVASSSSEFVLGAPMPAFPASLASGATLQIPVTFTPQAAGMRAGSITFSTSAGFVSFSVSGQGQSIDPNLTVSPPMISFGGTPPGGHVAQGITLANTGAASLTINNVTVPGAPFGATGAPAPGFVLAAGASITVTISFNPTAIGNYTSSVVIDSTVGTRSVQLSGVCASPGVMTVTPLSIDFGAVAVGGNATASFTVSNTGGTAVTVTKSKPPTLGSFLAQSNLPEGMTLAPGATLTEFVSFNPMGSGVASDGWVLNADDGGGVRTVQFTGLGASDLTAAGTPIALINAPNGGGSKSLAVISDGVFPAEGSTDMTVQYDTYTGDTARQEDWIGYQFAVAQTFGALTYQEGIHFSDGGWWSSLKVQVRQSGVWVDAGGLLVSPAYAGAGGNNYKTYNLKFSSIVGDAIRLDGVPGGSARFISVGELRVIGGSSGGTNTAPNASAGAAQTVNPGATVTLDGSGSNDPNGDAITYAWTQTAGPAVTLSSTTAQMPTFVAPSVSASTALTFSLVVNDGKVSSAPATVTITDTPAVTVTYTDVSAAGTIVAFVPNPTGGGSKNLNVIRDGVTPAVGSTSFATEFDTYNGTARTEDWIGYTFGSAQSFGKVVFQEGPQFSDGGWFNTLKIQVRQGGVWTAVAAPVISPAYPGANGVNYETFTFTFPAVSGDGIRIDGAPGGVATFISVGELRVFTVSGGGGNTNLAPTANAGTNQAVTMGATVTLDGSGSSDPNGDAISYAWTQTAGPAVTLSSTTAQKPTFVAPTVSATTAFTFSLMVSDGSLQSNPATVTVNVSRPANLAPTANAGSNQSVFAGATVTLDGSGSGDPNGDAITYAWTQTAGPAVTLSSTTAQKPTFVAPTVSASTALTFSLVVSDGSLQSSPATVTVTVSPTSSLQDVSAAGTPVALITAPTGGGNKNLSVIRDGVTPAVGSTSASSQYDTYNGTTRTEDWIGYTFASAQTFGKVVFQEGLQFSDGGWFTTVKIQVRQSGVWIDAPSVTVTPAYAGGNGITYETFTFTFPAITGDGIRIDGRPGGSATFITVGELRVFAAAQSGSNAAPIASAGANQAVTAGATVTLDGSGSSDPNGDAITYAWTQTAGPAVTLSSTTAQKPTFVAPGVSASTALTFRLVVSDGSLPSNPATVTVTVNPASATYTDVSATGTPVALVTAPTGGGSKNLAVIRDGVTPAVGSNSSSQQYDTYNGTTRSEDWVGYTFTSTTTFGKVVFQEGRQFSDGGWFTSLKIQVRQNNVWVDVPGAVVTPAYPGGNGVTYETFTFTFPAIAGTGIRIDGAPGGASTFISVGELRVFSTP